MKRIFSCILALMVLLQLTSCGSQDDPEKTSSPEKIAYAPEYRSIALDCERINTGYAIDGSIYFLGVWDYGSSGSVFRMDPDGTLTEIFSPADGLDGAYDTVTPYVLCAGEDNTFWLLLNCQSRWEAGSQFFREVLFCQYDGQGAELNRLDITNALSAARLDAASVSSIQLDAEGWLYLYGDGKVYVLDDQQTLQFSLSCQTMSYQCGLTLPDGRPAALVWEAKGPGEPKVYELRTIDKEAQGWGDGYPIPSDPSGRCDQVFPGGGQYLFFWNTGSAVYGWNGESADVLLDADNSDVNLDTNLFRCFAVLEDGQLAAVTWNNNRGELALLTPVDPSELPEKTVLTIACLFCPNKLQWYVTEFNKRSQDYRIEIKTYESGNSYAEDMQRMIVDITAGNVPDMLCMYRLPAQKFGATGLLEDLWPYIDADSELSREDLMRHVLECAELDGGLYEIFDSFSIKTVAGAAEVVGDRLSWTPADLEAALASMPEGCSAYGAFESSDYLLFELVNANMSRYVDWETGTNAFDSQEFKDLLAFVDRLDLPSGSRTEGYEWAEASVMDREQMLYTGVYGEGLTSFVNIQLFENLFNGPVSFVGHPRLDGACGSSFYVSSENVPIAMTVSCTDKEGAWSFLRTLLLPQEDLPKTPEQVRTVSAFPINRQDFDALARLSMEEMEIPFGQIFRDESGNEFSIRFSPLTQAEYDQIMELYNAIDSLYTEDSDVIEAVQSEASVYFSGDITVDEAASRIQKRVQLYLDEQR